MSLLRSRPLPTNEPLGVSAKVRPERHLTRSEASVTELPEPNVPTGSAAFVTQRISGDLGTCYAVPASTHSFWFCWGGMLVKCSAIACQRPLRLIHTDVNR